ncbi:MAG: 4Fe-4S binding protein [Gemmatimonadota bacterium]|nr:MAG: 4Fe-4S binding protein [Gemmatimonadota bacterium]
MTIRTVRGLRRTSQVAFFLVFFWLVLKTSFEVDFSPVQASDIRLPYPVSIALEFDPLAALMTLLASGTLYKGLLWSLVIVIPTIFMGRFFCGWICPLGSLNHWLSAFKSERRSRRGKKLLDSNRYKPYQRLKYYILFFCLGAALLGSLQAGLLDPLPLLARSIGTAVLPTLHTAVLTLAAVSRDTGITPIAVVGQGLYDALAATLLPFRQAHFHGLILIGTVFVVVLIMNRAYTRFWCRGICPLGALLGVFSRFAIFGLHKDEQACSGCNKCLLACQGADNPEVGTKWRQTECHMCLNCQAACPEGALQFRFFPTKVSTKTNPAGTSKIDISRRKLIASVIGGAAAVPLFRSGDAHEVKRSPFVIRPPGSLAEESFLGRCIRCGQCMRVCPNNALHPTLLESGIEGLWTPFLIAKIGYCEPTCTLCGQVCPTGAIEELTMVQKVGDEETPPLRIGTAFFDRGRCLPWAMATPCIVCEEWCPTSPKAIYLKEEVVLDREGREVTVQRPHVDPALCTGCGACEYACPVFDRKAVYVTSVGESRSPQNQILLERQV